MQADFTDAISVQWLQFQHKLQQQQQQSDDM
jgi:hypothetical protein